MDREQALNGAALISYSLLYFHHSYYIITFHNPAQGDKNRFFPYFPCFLSSLLLHLVVSQSFLWIQQLFIWDCRVLRVTIGYIWMHCFGVL